MPIFIVVAVLALVIVLLLKNKSITNESSLDLNSKPLNQGQINFVREKIEEHRDKYLNYSLFAESNFHDLRTSDLEKLLNGKPQEFAAPVLYFQNDDWVWQGDQLEQAVSTVLQELKIEEVSAETPTRAASAACEQWAKAEANRLIDEYMKS